MKVAIVQTSAWPLIGGLEKVGFRLAQHLQASGHEAAIVARFCEKRVKLQNFFFESEPEQVFFNETVETHVLAPVIHSRMLGRLVFKLIWRPSTLPIAIALHNLMFATKLARVSGRYDILHYLGTGAELLGFSAKNAALRSRVPLLVEPAIHQGQWGDGWIDRKLYQQADFLIAHTEHEKRVLSALGVGEDRMSTVRHGVDSGGAGDGDSFRRANAISGPAILFLGRKTREKGLHLTLDAFQIVRREVPNTVLVVMGPSNGKEYFDRGGGVIDIDDADEQMKNDALAACDTLCLPSRGESFGMVYFEAWAHRKPVVALDLPTLRETVGSSGGGILCDESTRSVATALTRILLTDALTRASMGERGFLFAKNYSWGRAIESYLDIYSRIMAKQSM